jgi:Rrf2 family protein
MAANSSSRLAVGTHVLSLLALECDRVLTSEYIAGSVNTNPVFVRRVLGLLHRAGLVVSRPGPGGGWQLAEAPERITLRRVREAVDDGPLLSLHHGQPNPACPIGGNVQRVLRRVFDDAEAAFEARLDETTVAAVLERLLATGPAAP